MIHLCSHMIDQYFRLCPLGIHFTVYYYYGVEFDDVTVFLPGSWKNHQIDAAVHIFEGDKTHGLALFGGMRPDAGDQTSHAHLLLVIGLDQFCGVMGNVLIDGIHHRAERMIGDIQTYQLALPIELFAARDLGIEGGKFDILLQAGSSTEHGHLPRICGCKIRRTDRHNTVEGIK